jgi:hypothetical protein
MRYYFNDSQVTGSLGVLCNGLYAIFCFYSLIKIARMKNLVNRDIKVLFLISLVLNAIFESLYFLGFAIYDK